MRHQRNWMDAREYVEEHQEETGHNADVDESQLNEDGRIKAYCNECAWEAWGYDSGNW